MTTAHTETQIRMVTLELHSIHNTVVFSQLNIHFRSDFRGHNFCGLHIYSAHYRCKLNRTEWFCLCFSLVNGKLLFYCLYLVCSQFFALFSSSSQQNRTRNEIGRTTFCIHTISRLAINSDENFAIALMWFWCVSVMCGCLSTDRHTNLWLCLSCVSFCVFDMRALFHSVHSHSYGSAICLTYSVLLSFSPPTSQRAP